MKKLRTVLVLLFALLMSLCLFACGGNEDKGGGTNPGGDDPVGPGPDNPNPTDRYFTTTELDVETIELTDSQDEAALQAALAELTITGRDEAYEEVPLTLEECDYDLSAVKIHEVGEYTLTFNVKDAQVDAPATLTVIIGHDWEKESDSTDVCKYDKARKVTSAEDVVMHFGTFHEGTNPAKYADAKAAAGWEEAAAYTNGKTDSKISEFGEVNGLKVPTLTAGKLEKGMTISIRGTSKTTVGEPETGVGSPWKAPQKYWNSSSLGIADRYNDYANTDHPGYKGGVSVIVRQEGWVLYNGIGEGELNRLGGIAGGFFEGTAANAWRNYGSNSTETATPTPGKLAEAAGYDNSELPTDWSTVGDWWVYSRGTGLNSGDFYKKDEAPVNYEYTWNYRSDGVVEIIYKIWTTDESNSNSLKAYIKVPDSEYGYDTIIHGDYNDLTITGITVTTKNTPKEFKFNGLTGADAQKVYAQNTQFNANTLDVQVEYEQTAGWNKVLVSNNDVYYYVGTMTREQLSADTEEAKTELNSTDSAVWKSLGSNMLDLHDGDNIYKIDLSKNGARYVTLIEKDLFTVLPNSILTVAGSDVTIGEATFANNGRIAGDAFTFAFDGTNVVFTLAEGYVQTMTDAQKAAMSVTNDARYIAIRLNKAELGAAFTAEGVQANEGAIPVNAQIIGDDVYVVLALTQAASVKLTGIQATPIILDLTALKGFSLSSEIAGKEGLSLNAGGELTLTYHIPADANAGDLQLFYRNGSNASIVIGNFTEGDSATPYSRYGYTFNEITNANGVVTVKLTVPGATLNAYEPLRFELRWGQNDSVVDYVDYPMVLADAQNYLAGENGYYAYAENDATQKTSTLNVVRAFSNEQLGNGSVSGSFTVNINDGDLDHFKAYGLITVAYEIVDGQLIIPGAPAYVTGIAVIRGTYGDNRDKDVGAYVVITIDVTQLNISGDYYVEFNNGAQFDQNTVPTTINKVSGATITAETVAAAECETAIIIEGSCQQKGLYAWAITKEGKIVFYANAAVAGGVHADADEDGVCDLCGATIAEITLTANENDNKFVLQDGRFVEVSGQYNDVAHTDAFQGLEVNVRNADGDEAFWVRVRNDGYYVREAGTDGQITLDSNTTPSNTCNGVPNGIDGAAIDAATDYLEAKKNGYFKAVASYAFGKVTVTISLWKADQETSETPYFQYTVVMTVVTNAPAINVNIRYDNNGAAAIGTAGDCRLIRGDVSRSTIENMTVEGADMTIANKGNIVTLTGNAPKDDNGYYVAFKANFNAPVNSESKVYVRNANGAIFEGATATLNEARTELSVRLPLAVGAVYTTITVDFVNFAGNTMQGDITVDLTRTFLSDVKAAADKTDLKLAGDTFVVTLTGTIDDTAKIMIGDAAVALSDLSAATEAAPVAIGETLFSVVGYNATTHAITIKYAGVADYMADLVETEIKIADANGNLLNHVLVYPDVLEGIGTQIEESGWYIVALGGKLALVSDKAAAETLPVIINAGQAASDANAVGAYNLGYKNGKFVDTNLATAAGQVVTAQFNGKTVTAIVITLGDLAGLGITDTTAYGVMLSNGAKYYMVGADKAVTEKAPADTDSEVTIAEHSCEKAGKKAQTNADKSFYWSFTVIPSHTYPATDTNGYYVCTECGAILRGGDVKNVTVPATLMEVEGEQTLVDTGLTVSFWADVADNDWAAIALKTSNNLIITLPNLDPWNAEGDASAMFKGYNKYPAGDEFINGSAYSVFLNTASYVTITISKTGGVTYYKNGLKVIAYAAATEFNLGAGQAAIDPVPTVASFVEEFLKDVEANGLIIGSGLKGASNVIIESKVYTDEQATARYNNYVSEKDYYPTHTHSYGDDDKCSCGEINPNHGDESKGGKPHNFDPATDKCTICGLFNPNHQHVDEHGENGEGEPDGICDICGAPINHQHTFENGLCTDCGAVCNHAGQSGETCELCGATLVADATFANPVEFTTWYDVPVTLEKGKEISMYGTMKSTMLAADGTDANHGSMIWESKEGFTGRMDSYGWKFQDNFGTAVISKLLQNLDASGEVVDGAFDWAIYRDICKDSNWLIRIAYASDDVLTVSMYVTSLSGEHAGYTFVCVYDVPIASGMAKEQYTFHLTAGSAGGCSEFTVTGYAKADTTISDTPSTPVTPETGTTNVPTSEIPSWVEPYQPKDVATLTDGTTVKVTGQFADAGTALWNGLMYWIRNGATNELLYVFRQAGDCATGAWVYGQGTTTPGFIGDLGEEKANAYIELKKNAKFEVVVTYSENTVTITVTVFGADDASTDDDQVLSVVLDNMTASSYKFAVNLDGATLTEAGLTVTTTVEAE